jgi:hypothetical protein
MTINKMTIANKYQKRKYASIRRVNAEARRCAEEDFFVGGYLINILSAISLRLCGLCVYRF